MLFRNLTVFRVGEGWDGSFEAAGPALARQAFVACGATDARSAGWVPPRGGEGEALVESVRGQWLMRLMVEQKIVPGAVVRRRTEEIADGIEQTTGRRPGRRQTREIKEQALQELLPRAFTKRAAVHVWLSPDDRWLVVDTGSTGLADEVVTLLVKALDGLAVQALHTVESPSAVMADWLVTGEPAADFAVDRECELKTSDEMKSVVRYARHPLDIEEVRQHIAQGKRPTRLAVTWSGRVSFTLTESMQLRRLEFLDGVLDEEAGRTDAERFDADAAIVTAELQRLLPALVEALGGEHRPVT